MDIKNLYLYNNNIEQAYCAREFKLSAQFGTLKNTKLNNYNKDMLIGCLLGDAHVGRSGDKSYITFEQTIKHENYIKNIYDSLKKDNIDLYNIKYYTRNDLRHASINKSVYFKTHNLELFNPIADMFLSVDNKKILPIDIEYYLNPIGLAFWICDDGQLVKNGGITLCTDNYSLNEVELLINVLYYKYNAKCSIHKKKGKSDKIYNRIYISKSSFNDIKPLICKYVDTSFLYKLHLNK